MNFISFWSLENERGTVKRGIDRDIIRRISAIPLHLPKREKKKRKKEKRKKTEVKAFVYSRES